MYFVHTVYLCLCLPLLNLFCFVPLRLFLCLFADVLFASFAEDDDADDDDGVPLLALLFVLRTMIWSVVGRS